MSAPLGEADRFPLDAPASSKEEVAQWLSDTKREPPERGAHTSEDPLPEDPFAPLPVDDTVGIEPMQPGFADNTAPPLPVIPGSPGGLVETQRQSSGINPDAANALRQHVEEATELERKAVLEEALLKEAEFDERERRRKRLEAEVAQERAKAAVEKKQILANRAKAQKAIKDVSAQEPDRNRAFPTGFALFSTLIGAVAGGMLQGLNGGSNPVLDALDHRLDEDVRQQRLTQSERIKDLTRQLGSADAAEDMLRAEQKQILLKELEAQTLGSQNATAHAAIDAFRARANAEIERHEVDALSKLERDLTIQEVNQPSTPDRVLDSGALMRTALNDYSRQTGIEPRVSYAHWIKYNERFQEMAPFREGVANVRKALARYEETGDVAGFGLLGRQVPASLASKDAKEARQLIGNVVAQYLKQISGAAVTEEEYARTIDTIIASGDYDDIDRGIGILESSLRARDAASEIENPLFYQLRQDLSSALSRTHVTRQPGRAQQIASVEEPVTIPKTSRIALEHNNPGNLMYAGQRGATRGEPKKGGGYWARFDSVEAGMTALYRQMLKNQDRGLNLRQHVQRYAPVSDDNDTESYILKLGQLVGADEATPLAEVDASKLAYAHALLESGSRP